MTYKPVYAHDKLREEVLNDLEARAIYEATKLQIELSLELKRARIERNMTQEDVAKLIHTKKPVISRLESGSSNVKHFPSLLTLAKIASAVGCELNIGLKYKKKPKPLLKAVRKK